MWSAVAVAKREGMGGESFPIGEGVLGGNQCRTHHLLYKTLLGAPVEGCVQEKGERCYLTCNHLPRQPGCVCSHAQCLGPVHMATECGSAMGHHRGGAVWLPPQECHGPWGSDASNGVQGH